VLGPQASETMTLYAHLGGRLRIGCFDQEGNALPAQCRLVGADGVEFPPAFMTQAGGSAWGGDGSLNARAPGGVNETMLPLPPGKYQVRLSLEGYREAMRVATVEPGGVGEVSIVLERQ